MRAESTAGRAGDTLSPKIIQCCIAAVPGACERDQRLPHSPGYDPRQYRHPRQRSEDVAQPWPQKEADPACAAVGNRYPRADEEAAAIFERIGDDGHPEAHHRAGEKADELFREIVRRVAANKRD
jgi:hypothetical protein